MLYAISLINIIGVHIPVYLYEYKQTNLYVQFELIYPLPVGGPGHWSGFSPKVGRSLERNFQKLPFPCQAICYDRQHTVLAPSFGHPELLTHFLFNCYQTSYTASSTLYLHIYQLF